jgi:hypothetical protein
MSERRLIGEVHHLDWRLLAELVRAEVGHVDALIVDAPYSERTHKGHDDGTATANRVADFAKRGKGHAWYTTYAAKKAAKGEAHRRQISYQPWAAADVAAFVETWAPLTSGWIVSLTDHVLAPAWEAAMLGAGRYVFAPIACVEPGGRCRMLGDGPAQWSSFAVVSRPKSGAWLEARKTARDARKARGEDANCALPGAYVAGEHGKDVPGGKPLALMEALVRDYSEPGDLVCDPCAGGGTTLLAAKLLGRRYVGSDIGAAHVEIARERLRDLPSRPKAGTLALFGDQANERAGLAEEG